MEPVKTGFKRSSAPKMYLDMKYVVSGSEIRSREWLEEASQTPRLETCSERTCPRDRTPGKATPYPHCTAREGRNARLVSL